MNNNRFSLLTTLAWRNLWRHPKRTIVILFAIMLGIWFMIVSAGMMVGIMEQQVRDTIFNLTGHIQLHHKKYLDDPAIEHSMPAPNEALQQLLDDPLIKTWSPRVRLPAITMSERESAGVFLLGINPEAEKGLSFIGNPVVEGRGLESIADKGIVIGQRMADKLETRIGKRIVLMAQGKDGEVADRGFRIVGLYQAELEATETAYVFIGLETAQQLLGMEGEISEISLITNDRELLVPLVERLRTNNPQLDIMSWEELQPFIVTALKVYDNFMLIWYLIIFAAMAFGLTNTLLMSVFERTREIGLFQALGMQPRFIIGQVLIETLILLLVGAVLGNLSGWFTTNIIFAEGIDLSQYAQGMETFKMSSIMEFKLEINDLVTINLLVIVLGLISSLYPAVKAARYVPVEAITRN